MKSYAVRGFHIALIHVDIQLKSIKDRKLLGTDVNVVSKGEHVPEIERMNRVSKERARCYFAMVARIGIYVLPRTVVIQLMITVAFYVNAFVWRLGVSQILPPLTIVEGTVVDFQKHFHVLFGEYVHTYEGTDNTMKPRTVGALALGPSGNLQGGVRCYSLITGKVLHRQFSEITILKMPEDAKRRLTFIVNREKSIRGLIFGDRNNNVDPDCDITGVNVNANDNANDNENDNENDDDLVVSPYDLETEDHDVPNGLANDDTGNTGVFVPNDSSPTPDFYAFKYVVATIAKEGRDIATIDLPGFFLQTEQEKDSEIILRLTGSVAILLVESDEKKWKKHLRREKGQWVIYVLCNRAIYGTMNASLLAYKKLAKLLTKWGFVMNVYDPCVWNKLIERTQCTIMYHIDDILAGHLSPEVITMFVKRFEKEYATLDPLTVRRGKLHEYLGITLDFRWEGEVALSMYDYLKKMHDSLPDSMKSTYRNTPAPEDLFKVDPNDTKLDSKRKEEYHHVTAQTLWASQRARPDLQLASGFHCTRVKSPGEQDWKKMAHLQGYIWKTRYLPLIIAITEDGAIIYIDGAHAVHTDCKGHSGMVSTMGKGAMMSVSKKLGLVTRSSTETEVVSTGERMPKCTWLRYFRIAQGDRAKEDILMQDNEVCIILHKNWPFSTGKGSQHINVRYFFVVDKIKNKEVKVIFCPTDKMVADYQSKPLQGVLFVTHRNTIMGVRPEDFDRYKRMYVEVLKHYELYDDEDDLFDI